MRESMAQLTPRFSADRAVREYTEQHYLPAAPPTVSALPIKARSAGKMVDWQHAGGSRSGARCASETLRRSKPTRPAQI
jgi:hypothetical protein